MLEEYQKLPPLKTFRGLYKRGTPEECPIDHFTDSQNLSFKPGNFGIRPGSSLKIDFGVAINDMVEWVPTNASPPYPVLGIDANGTFWLWQTTGVTNLYNVPNATNFVGVNFFGRLFICPTNASGAVGNLLHLYYPPNSTTPTIRPCGCDIPISNTAMTATVNTQGGQTGNVGPQSPTAVDQSGGSTYGGLNPWQDLPNALAQDGQYAIVHLYGSNNEVNSSTQLQVTGFDFSTIPDNAAILGIQVEIWHDVPGYQSGWSAVYDSSIVLLGVPSNNKYNATPWNHSVEETYTYGDSTDLWGNTAGSLLGADINSQQFGVGIVVDCSVGGYGAIAGIDFVSVQVWWQTAAGNVQQGTYQIGVVYETDTGFISPPATSPNLDIQAVVTQDNCSITLTNVPISPLSYITARYIIVATVDQLGDIGEYFFVPDNEGGSINDNTTMSTTLSFYITDLVESADNLFNLRARIPAGQNINVYSARLLLLGFLPPDSSLARASNKSDPETFDQTLESIIVGKDDGYLLTNNAILNTILYFWKEKGVWSTYDNGSDPVNWDVEPIDDSVGCGFRGLSCVSPPKARGSHANVIAFADHAGLYLFNGSVVQPELTWKVEDLWQTLTDASGLNVIIDIQNKRIIIFGFDESSALYQASLVGDFSEGASSQAIKWDIWTYHINCRLLSASTGTGTDVVTILSSGKIIKLDSTQYVDYVDATHTSPINHFATLGGQELEEGQVNIFRAITMKVIGSGLIHTAFIGEGDQESTTAWNRVDLPLVLLDGSTKKEITNTSNFMGEKCYPHFEAQPPNSTDPDDEGAYFIISRIILYAQLMFAERPQL